MAVKTSYYPHKSSRELRASLLLFQLLSYPLLVRIVLLTWQVFRIFRFPVLPLIRFAGYYQFCAGKDVSTSAAVTSKMARFGVKSVLDYTHEHATNETDFNDNTAVILQTIQASAQNNAYPFAVLKPTALGAFSLFEKRSKGIALSDFEVAAWERTKSRLEQCAKLAAASEIVLMIDAEESWIQPGVDAMVFPLMKKYNQKRVVVAITLQLYLKGTYERYKHLVNEAEDYFIGVKLVRGAYMEKERQRATTLGIPSPVCETKAHSDNQYRQALEFAVEKLSRNLCIVATHNEDDIDWVVKMCKHKDIPLNHKNLWFSQLYGMRDYISFELAAKAANVFKYVPFGPLKQSIPYLIRRALENSSVKTQTARELAMIRKELRLRKINA